MTEQPLWTPDAERLQFSRMAVFQRAIYSRHAAALPDYRALHCWSIEQPRLFWRLLWDFCGVIGEPGQTVLVDGDKMPGARWFPEARLNFAENLLRVRDDTPALVFWGEDQALCRLSHAELYRRVAALAVAFQGAGVGPGDVVAAWMPNMPETIVAMLAAASLGAIFSSCSPDFGAQGVLDRFGQIQPKLLIAADGYRYNGRVFDSTVKLAEVAAALPSVQKVLIVAYANQHPDLSAIPKAIMLDDFVSPYAGAAEIHFTRRPFDHPLYILYSSGTTGAPKCIVHGAGGTLLQHLKEHQLHGDVRPGDRLFYFTTCGWMMWNWLVSGLASGATLLLYDGSPFLREGRILFDYADAEAITHLGVSAKFIDTLAKTGLHPAESHRLEALRAIFSTGSPLAPERFDFVYRHIKSNINLASISGGSDIVSCFVLGCPILPVWRGEIQCGGLGMAVDVVEGELVCRQPFPSMPRGFLNDPEGVRYRAAYFEKFPGMWAHGDYAEITRHDGIVIHGRSDAVLNPGGVRIGTAEIYRQAEQIPEVMESLAISQDWEGDVRIVLFVRLREGATLDEALAARIKQAIRQGASPRHVPARIIAVADIPRTRSGKIVELAVRDVVHGRPVKNREALANPEALALFGDLPELRT